MSDAETDGTVEDDLPDVQAMRTHEGDWQRSLNVGARRLLSDPDAVSVTVTYDDGSQVIFHRTPSQPSEWHLLAAATRAARPRSGRRGKS